jgi:hypothetical protein
MIRMPQQQARYAIPIVLAIVEFAGLLSALVGDGVYDIFSWFTLTVPLILLAVYLTRPKWQLFRRREQVD